LGPIHRVTHHHAAELLINDEFIVVGRLCPYPRGQVRIRKHRPQLKVEVFEDLQWCSFHVRGTESANNLSRTTARFGNPLGWVGWF
jgi:hypothetical protein